MKPHIASFINAVILISFGLWAYFTSENPSMTALIPVIIGGILLVIVPGVKKEAKVTAHIAVLLTLVVLLGLIMPLMGALDRGSTAGIVRVAVMIFSTAFALLTFIRSFIEVRRKRKLESN
tara:strand:- start:154 stop:516 length:363 start_codon:yes stop_codon:yes gene_type:complete